MARTIAKPRLDELLVQRGLFENVHDATAAIIAGEVVVGEHRETSAGRRVKPDVPVRVKKSVAFASRGGIKLAGALEHFAVDARDKRCLDIGASTGGFTDCLLQHGAKSVCAIDVGEPLMRWELQLDDRVDYRSKTDIRSLGQSGLHGVFELVVGDLSFISLATVMADIAHAMDADADALLLVKPQFEVEKSEVGEGGIVRSAHLHERALARVATSARLEGLSSMGAWYSQITGTKGNIEFFIHAIKASADQPVRELADDEVKRAVAAAHETLEGSS